MRARTHLGVRRGEVEIENEEAVSIRSPGGAGHGGAKEVETIAVSVNLDAGRQGAPKQRPFRVHASHEFRRRPVASFAPLGTSAPALSALAAAARASGGEELRDTGALVSKAGVGNGSDAGFSPRTLVAAGAAALAGAGDAG